MIPIDVQKRCGKDLVVLMIHDLGTAYRYKCFGLEHIVRQPGALVKENIAFNLKMLGKNDHLCFAFTFTQNVALLRCK
jgi:hypothetical protein